MLKLLSPISLLALAAVAVPLAIHLWNRKQGRPIKVGSIKFLQESESYRFNRTRLTEIPLLLLRCSLLAVLAFLLASPQWIPQRPAEAQTKGWVLVAPELLQDPAAAALFATIDSLTSEGNELRLLAAGFPQVSLGDSVHTVVENLNYWSLLREAETIAPSGGPLWVFTPNGLRGFRGERPAMAYNLHWTSYSSGRRNVWIEEAERVSNDSLRLVLGFSDSSLSYFQRYFLAMPPSHAVLSRDGASPLEVTIGADGVVLRLVQPDAVDSDNAVTLPVGQSGVSVLICHGVNRDEDARYLHAAMEAVAEFDRSPGRIAMVPTASRGQITGQFDWVFWLSSEPVPADLQAEVEGGLCLFEDARSTEYTEGQGWVQLAQTPHTPRPRLFRRVKALTAGAALWLDAWDEPLLGLQRKGRGLYLTFHSRLHPTWNELVLHSAFPEAVRNLLELRNSPTAVATARTSFSDQRMISAGQLRPWRRAEREGTWREFDTLSLHIPVLIVATLLFILERWMASRKGARDAATTGKG